MKVFKNWILPIFRILIFAAISVALVKIAFFADEEKALPAEPGGSITTPTYEVVRGTVYNEIPLQATINRNANLQVKSGVTGEVREVSVVIGSWVNAGDKIVTIRQDRPRRDILITAPQAGTIKNISPIVGQYVNLGEVVAELSPESFTVSGNVQPAELYRLLDAPAEAEVSIQGGPAPFTCTGLKIVSVESGSTVNCAVPAEVKVFAGLMASLSIRSGVAEDVIVIPVTAVEGGAGSGNVWVKTAQGEEVRPVTLGLSDGTMVEVTEGLSEAETILQFVPGLEQKTPGMGDCITNPDGSVVCPGDNGTMKYSN